MYEYHHFDLQMLEFGVQQQQYILVTIFEAARIKYEQQILKQN